MEHLNSLRRARQRPGRPPRPQPQRLPGGRDGSGTPSCHGSQPSAALGAELGLPVTRPDPVPQRLPGQVGAGCTPASWATSGEIRSHRVSCPQLPRWEHQRRGAQGESLRPGLQGSVLGFGEVGRGSVGTKGSEDAQGQSGAEPAPTCPRPALLLLGRPLRGRRRVRG